MRYQTAPCPEPLRRSSYPTPAVSRTPARPGGTRAALLSAPPAGRAALVLEDHAKRCQLVANAVGLGPILARACRGARRDAPLDLGVVDAAGTGEPEPLLRRHFEESERLTESTQLRAEGGGARRIARRARRVDLARQPLEHRERLRRIEVIIHARAEARTRRTRLHRRRWEPPQRRVDARQRRVRVLELLERVIDRPAVVAREEEEAQHLRMAQRLQHFAQREEVAERFRHLLVVNVDEAVVHPQVDELVPGRRARLRDLVLVVRELEVEAAAVEVEVRAEERGRHGRALDVPAGAPAPPRRIPPWLAGLGALPQHEIERVALGL